MSPILRHDFDASLKVDAGGYAQKSGRDSLEKAFAEVGNRILSLKSCDLIERACPLCGDKSPHDVVFIKYAVPIVKCASCDFKFASPIPTVIFDSNQKIWGDVFDRHHVSFLTSSTYIFYAKMRYQYEIEFVNRFFDTKDFSLLDIGASTGTFLDVAKRYVKKSVGIEMNAEAVKIANQNNHNIIHGMFPLDDDRIDQEYDFIVSLDTLEHIIEPTCFLNSINNKLKPGGLLFIQVPNAGSLSSILQGKADNIFNGLIHFNYFTPKSLIKIAEDCGFRMCGIETILSEWHIVKSFSKYNIANALGVCDSNIDILSPDYILDNGLGYKIICLFQKI